MVRLDGGFKKVLFFLEDFFLEDLVLGELELALLEVVLLLAEEFTFFLLILLLFPLLSLLIKLNLLT